MTIYDIARKAGISIATVSRVLNKPDLVSKATREKVYSIMREADFIPRAEARDRARKHVGRIGVIAPNLTYPSFTHRLRGISGELKGDSWELVLLNLDEDEAIRAYLQSPDLKHRIDGFIFLSLKLNQQTLKIVKEIDIPAVFVEFGEENFSSVCTDNLKGGEMAAKFLLDRNFQSLGIITEKEDDDHVHPNQLRVTGFKNYFHQHQKGLKDIAITYGENSLEKTIEIAEKFLRQEHPEAVFATTDLLAVALRKAAVKLGLSIPGDLSLIGFDGTNTSEYVGLTTVDQYLEESGRLSAQLLMRRIKEPHSPIQNIYLPLKIIERETTKPLT